MSLRWLPPTRRAVGSLTIRRARVGVARRSRVRVVVESLEDRSLMTGTIILTPPIIIEPAGSLTPDGGNGPGGGFSPAQIRQAYGYDSINVGGIVGNGAGQTIAIVDAYDAPNFVNSTSPNFASSDLAVFDKQFGLPDPPSFTKYNQNGSTTNLPGTDPSGAGNPSGTWEAEESLDVEWAHAIAPMASIDLIEANSASTSDLVQTAVRTAASLPGVSVVSMSFGGGEDPSELSLDSLFTTPAGHTGVTFLAATGDNGSPGGYPAYSPNVVAVGGTSLFLNADNSYQSEVGWNGSGGGVSQYEPVPSYQSRLNVTGRSIPDVSSLADPNTGVSILDTYDNYGPGGYAVIGGTSLACPTWGGLIAITNQVRVANGDSILDSPTTLAGLYSLPSNAFHDVLSGSNGGFSAGPGYDNVTGLGTPIAPVLVSDLAPERVSVSPTPLNPVETTPLSNVQVATFTDRTGTFPASNYTATVNWGDGTAVDTATIKDLGGGTFGVFDSHTYDTYGNLDLTITVTNTANGIVGTGVETVPVQDAPLTPSPVAITATEASNFSGVVGNFSDAATFDTASNFTALIDWGDGRVKPGTVTALGNGQFSVSGSNDYALLGEYAINVAVTKDNNPATTFTIGSSGVVNDAPLTSTPKTFTAIAGFAYNGTVASFTDADPNATSPGFDVSINWGDGTPLTNLTNGQGIYNLGTRFDVRASHTYAVYGTYPVTVTVVAASNDGIPGSITTTTSTATISDAPIRASSTSLTTTEGTSFSGQVATFTSSNPIAPVSNFSATIDWGDGTTTPGTITQPKGQGTPFIVDGTHTYAAYSPTPYPITVSVVSKGGRTATANPTATVLDAPYSTTGATVSQIAGQPVTQPVATIHDSYALVPATAFTATIDWGDGTTTPGTITQPGGQGTPFEVIGSHTYAQSATYPVSVSIVDVAGVAAKATSSAQISDAPLTAQAASPGSPIVGSGFSGTLGSFSTPNLLSTPTNFVAQINWGDGTSSGGIITEKSPGSFTVSSLSPHVYTYAAAYPVTMTVISLGGNRSTTTTTLNVKDAPIVGAGSPTISTVAGTPYNGEVGTFSSFSGYDPSVFQATINWGNGAITPGIVTAGTNGTFTVSGANLYTTAGVFSPVVTVTDAFGTTGTFKGVAVIGDAAIASTAQTLTAIQGQPFSGAVATFTDGNPYAPASQFYAVVNWGDGTPNTFGFVTGGSGQFAVYASHTFSLASPNLPVTVAIQSRSGSSSMPLSTAHVLIPLTAALSPATDTGVSATDGITADNHPIFYGRAEPGATVTLYAAAVSSPTIQVMVGQTQANAAGNWVVMISPLGDGSYVFNATMNDPFTGNIAQVIRPATGTTGGPLVIATSGPRVAALSFDPRLDQLHVMFQTSPASMNLAGLTNGANYSLGLVNGFNVVPFAATNLAAAAGPNGLVFVTVTYNFGQSVSAGSYVVTLNASGLPDLAGNVLNEQHFVTFPQTSNYPNPNYVAEINVGSNLVASAPVPYVSLAEQIAANNYANQVHSLQSRLSIVSRQFPQFPLVARRKR